jgi:hypothetical protein
VGLRLGSYSTRVKEFGSGWGGAGRWGQGIHRHWQSPRPVPPSFTTSFRKLPSPIADLTLAFSPQPCAGKRCRPARASARKHPPPVCAAASWSRSPCATSGCTGRRRRVGAVFHNLPEWADSGEDDSRSNPSRVGCPIMTHSEKPLAFIFNSRPKIYYYYRNNMVNRNSYTKAQGFL